MSSAGTSKKTVTVAPEHPVNLLFKYWLEKWKNEAIHDDNQLRFTYGNALKFLKKCPLALKSGTEAKQLVKNVGDKVGRKLDDALSKYKNEFGHDVTLDQVKSFIKGHKTTSKNKSHVSPKPIAQKRELSMSHSFFDRIRPEDQPSSSTDQSQPSMAPPKKQPKLSSSQPPLSLSNGAFITNNDNSSQSLSRIPSQSHRATTQNKPIDHFQLSKNDFEIVLLIDTHEKTTHFEGMVKIFNEQNISYDMRTLSVGDFLWVARRRHDKKELVLDCVVERKRFDDLGHSIKDDSNRYREQKARIRECGFKYPIFLVEMMKSTQLHTGGVPASSLYQAIVNTQVHDRFLVKVTKDSKDTALYLASLTKGLKTRFKEKHLISCSMADLLNLGDALGDYQVPLMPFDHFNETAAKSRPLSVRELFTRQLMVIRGMTGEKASAVANKYGSFTIILQAYAACNRQHRESLLADIVINDRNQKVGMALSKNVAKFFCYGMMNVD